MKREPYPVAILAGGLATRLHPLTHAIPKCLVDVDGQPFVSHQLRLLRDHGIHRVVLCVGHLGQLVRDQVGAGEAFGLDVDYSEDGGQLLGTAGAIRKALSKLGEEFFVMYGDSYLPCNFGELQGVFEARSRPALMAVFRNDGEWDESNVEFGHGDILAYDKRNPTPRMRYIDCGLGIFRREIFSTVPDGSPYDLSDLYQCLLENGSLAAHEVHERFYEIGSFAGLEETRQYFASRTRLKQGGLP